MGDLCFGCQSQPAEIDALFHAESGMRYMPIALCARCAAMPCGICDEPATVWRLVEPGGYKLYCGAHAVPPIVVVADCPPCEDLASFKAALVEMRRGLVSLERGFAALLAAVDRDGCG